MRVFCQWEIVERTRFKATQRTQTQNRNETFRNGQRQFRVALFPEGSDTGPSGDRRSACVIDINESLYLLRLPVPSPPRTRGYHRPHPTISHFQSFDFPEHDSWWTVWFWGHLPRQLEQGKKKTFESAGVDAAFLAFDSNIFTCEYAKTN